MSKVSLSQLERLHNECAGRVKYKLGAKTSIGIASHHIRSIDCSGYIRWLLGTGSGFIMPDGSQVQREFIMAKGFRQLARYADVQYAAGDPGRLFICFLSPAPGKAWPRHVWLVQAGKTIESCGSKGVCSRPWDTKALNTGRAVAFELPTR